LDDDETDVTVMVTASTTPWVLPIIEKVVAAVLVVIEELKNGVLPPSGFAITFILTPPDGMAEVTVTIKGKFGPGAAASTCPFAMGEVTTTRLGSELPPEPF
jgi:hypothetical protein